MHPVRVHAARGRIWSERINDLIPSRIWSDVLRRMEADCEPIRWAMGGPPFQVDRPSPD
jgi:hypothetical protein